MQSDSAGNRIRMNAPALTDRIMAQGKALVRAIDTLGTIEPSRLFEQAIAALLLAAHKRRLRAIIEAAPAWVSEEILGASEHIGDRRAAVWFGKNSGER